jgi:hypothetical protein
MYTVNPELMSLAQAKLEKEAVVMPGDPAAAGMDPAAAAAGAPPTDPAAMGAVQPAAPMAPQAPADPASAMAAMQMGGSVPAPMPPATPTGGASPAGQQKLKPEQMMQMLDYRLYNMQQQLTAIMNAMGVQVAPESLVLPPGTTGAPPAETALPGGPMAPPPQDPNAAAGGPPAPGGPVPPGGPMDPSALPPDAAKSAWWTQATKVASPNQPTEMQIRAQAIAAVYRSLQRHES